MLTFIIIFTLFKKEHSTIMKLVGTKAACACCIHFWTQCKLFKTATYISNTSANYAQLIHQLRIKGKQFQKYCKTLIIGAHLIFAKFANSLKS